MVRIYDSSSNRDKADGYFVTRDMMVYFWDLYLRDKSDGEDPYVSLMKAKDLSRLPPAMVMTGEYDPLCDDGAGYADRLKQAGVATTCICYEGTIHFFLMMPDKIDQGKQSVADACAALRDAFGR